MRDEGDGVIDSLEETFRIGRELGVPVVISHHKVVGHAEPRPLGARRCRSSRRRCARRRSASTAIPTAPPRPSCPASRAAIASKVLVTWSKPHPEFAGMDLADIAAKMGLPIEEAVAKLLPGRRDLLLDGRSRRAAHPRLRAHHDRLRRPAARRRAASAPVGHLPARARALLARARPVSAGDRGPQDDRADREDLRPRRTAACCAKAPSPTSCSSTPARSTRRRPSRKPIQPAKGIDTVIVNGAVVWRDGKPTGARPGRVLRRSG